MKEQYSKVICLLFQMAQIGYAIFIMEALLKAPESILTLNLGLVLSSVLVHRQQSCLEWPIKAKPSGRFLTKIPL
jgi:hypothetical protein